MLESADSDGSNPLVRKDVWVRSPPAALLYHPSVPARSRPRRLFRRLSVLSVVVGGLLALRDRKLAENQRRFDLP